jgi:hypothetical protein
MEADPLIGGSSRTSYGSWLAKLRANFSFWIALLTVLHAFALFSSLLGFVVSALFANKDVQYGLWQVCAHNDGLWDCYLYDDRASLVNNLHINALSKSNIHGIRLTRFLVLSSWLLNALMLIIGGLVLAAQGLPKRPYFLITSSSAAVSCCCSVCGVPFGVPLHLIPGFVA